MANGAPEQCRPQNMHVPHEAIVLLTHEQAMHFRVCPVAISPPNVDGMRTLTLACADARHPQLARELQRVLGCGVSLVPAAIEDVLKGIEVHYSRDYVDAPTGDIRAIIREMGVPSLLDDGLEKARAGITSLDEVMRAVYVDTL